MLDRLLFLFAVALTVANRLTKAQLRRRLDPLVYTNPITGEKTTANGQVISPATRPAPTPVTVVPVVEQPAPVVQTEPAVTTTIIVADPPAASVVEPIVATPLYTQTPGVAVGGVGVGGTGVGSGVGGVGVGGVGVGGSSFVSSSGRLVTTPGFGTSGYSVGGGVPGVGINGVGIGGGVGGRGYGGAVYYG
uniref:Uncharacterized protein n=1 Tax=Chromera velia CCMP2878 TaxID=1169474 RepID=A0A0G4HIF0_9ALVE|eukprot:Cvel_6988.t1-p1 / transcript=Cvel_6988.t1 / gene=Cvel_6988 / organism=Chromera_velia_CCMP2878 / gene_product=hypothetical protein / transcript_product=hypothetical protein / location=Cvel_scaffold355:54176-54745(+) / protein_length=190 / sequence_SO=supercontig / SO=protein_coding / is_pseudo=false